MTADVETAALRVQHLTRLTRDLTDRLSLEMDALRAHRAQDLNEGMAQTQEMANLYRRESAQVKANPAAIAAAPEADRHALIEATEVFETVLAEHAVTVEAARQISEGLVRTIAAEVAGARAQGVGYGASGQAMQGDGRAVALNRTA
ncbi:flagellar basal-body protein FlbY [Brevundimonas sp. LPMIX5]|jgi:predicted RNA-binding Zn ribbon-like protein|uniref:flagellar basal-body protein FlbY n=1 Tax=Brevundimonas sp. LPMIX5 TaxID=2305887 RepID=UPI000E6758EF|nr:flagellar basal-body protein FlbY [Brevundimonas sp. LPMIX5]RIJ68211.1 flagellar basal-body protein FlbY [Brevundimonas sp. LPMIX5]